MVGLCHRKTQQQKDHCYKIVRNNNGKISLKKMMRCNGEDQIMTCAGKRVALQNLEINNDIKWLDYDNDRKHSRTEIVDRELIPIQGFDI